MPREDYKATCDKLREKTGSTNLIKSSEIVQRIEEVYEKGKAEGGTDKPEQEKTIEISKNGTTEVLPDDGKVLSKVTVNINVPSNDVFSGMIDGSIKEAIIPENITKINHYAFANCAALSKIVLHEKITFIGYSAFYLCTALKDLILPASITALDGDAIGRCDNLVNLTVNCVLTHSIVIGGNNLTNESVNSVLYALADLTGKTSQYVKFASPVVERLTEEQYMIAENKNWTIR